MATTEENFPRGGILKQPVESKIVVQRAEVDNLFQVPRNFFSQTCWNISGILHDHHPVNCFSSLGSLFQTAEQKESKKRKGGPKDCSHKLKKPKKDEKEGGLALNTAAKTVTILHIKVTSIFSRFICIIWCEGNR